MLRPREEEERFLVDVRLVASRRVLGLVSERACAACWFLCNSISIFWSAVKVSFANMVTSKSGSEMIPWFAEVVDTLSKSEVDDITEASELSAMGNYAMTKNGCVHSLNPF